MQDSIDISNFIMFECEEEEFKEFTKFIFDQDINPDEKIRYFQ